MGMQRGRHMGALKGRHQAGQMTTPRTKWRQDFLSADLCGLELGLDLDTSILTGIHQNVLMYS